MGRKGCGKTKRMIELCNESGRSGEGQTVCLELGTKLLHDVIREVRLVDVKPYAIGSFQVLRGFITGLYAGNFDITHVFIDSLFKVSGESDMDETEKFVLWAEGFGEQNGISFTISVSADAEDAGEGLKKFL